MRTIEELRAAIADPATQDRTGALTELEALLGNPPEPDARAQLDALRENRGKLADEFEQVTRGAVDDKGDARDFTPEEAELRGSLTARIDQADAQITQREDAIRQDEANARKKEMTDAIAQVRKDLGLGDGLDIGPDGLRGVGVSTAPVYERGNGISYLRDMIARSLGSGIGSEWARANERLGRFSQENHQRALDLEERATRTPQEQYFVRQMIEQFSDRESNRGGLMIAPSLLSYRALSTASTAGGEFVPPMYLTEQWIEYLRAARVIANCMHHEDLPDGTMSINIPKVTGGTTVRTQGTQNTNISDTDLQTVFVTFPVVTFAGQQVVSLQLLERSPIAFDQVIMKDLGKAHAQDVDVQVLNGKGEAGEVTGLLNTAGINTTTWTQASPTIKGLYGRIGQSKANIYEGTTTTPGLFMPATHCFMSGNCWEWIGQSFDANERPLVVPEYNGPFNAVQVAPDEMTAEEAVGRNLNGLKTFEDANIPNELGTGKNQDVAIICRGDEHYLYESPIVTRMLPQTLGTQLSMVLQLYNYGAFTAARYPQATAVVTGTGMARANRTFNS